MELSRFEIFSEFQINNFLTDIQITLINGSIKAHKLVLAASSEFFKALLNSDVCKEVSTGIINLPSLDFDVFNYIFDYIYLRLPESQSKYDLSFYIEVIEASDYLRMVDLIRMIDFKISEQFSFLDLCKEFDKLSAYPLVKTKLKIQNQFIEYINLREYSNLIVQPAQILVKILEMENFTVNENVLWEFLSFFLTHTSDPLEIEFRQKLIDSIRPGLLDNVSIDSFYRYLSRTNFLWSDKTCDDLQQLLSNLPTENIRQMNFHSDAYDSKTKHIIQCRSTPHLIIKSIGANNSLILSKISLTNFDHDNRLVIDIDSDRFRHQTSANHLIFINKDWDLNGNLGAVLNLVNYRHCPISRWQYHFHNNETTSSTSSTDHMQNYHKFWGFSVVLCDAELFLFGGCYFTHSHQTVPSGNIVKFRFQDNTWQQVDNIRLKVACWSSSVCRDTRTSHGEQHRFFVSGGRSLQKYLKTFYLIDLQTSSLIDYPNLPFSMTGHRMEMMANGESPLVIVYGGAWDGGVRHEVALFHLRSSIWNVVSIGQNIMDSIHIDYCCRTVASNNKGSKRSNDHVDIYDLRTGNRKTCLVYLHRIEMMELSSSPVVHTSQCPIDIQCDRPLNLMFAMSLKLPDQSISIH